MAPSSSAKRGEKYDIQWSMFGEEDLRSYINYINLDLHAKVSLEAQESVHIAKQAMDMDGWLVFLTPSDNEVNIRRTLAKISSVASREYVTEPRKRCMSETRIGRAGGGRLSQERYDT